MNPFMFFYTEFFWRPLFNVLVWLYTVLPGHDLGVAVIVLTLLIRVALFPVLHKSQKTQKELARIQPELKRIQEQFKHNREQQTKAIMELYARERVSPFSGCLTLLIQLPILIALFSVFQKGLDAAGFVYLYSFISRPEIVNNISFGILDLAHPSIFLGVFAAISQYYQIQISSSSLPPQSGQTDFARAMQTQTKYIIPLVILFSSFQFPSVLTLYWTAFNIFGIVQELMIKRWSARNT